MTATVPAGASCGRWRVPKPGSTATNVVVFNVTSPRITTFSPTSGLPGGTVTINGSGFLNVSQVTLGNINTFFTVDSPTKITALVPFGLEYGRWRVITPLWTDTDPIVYSATG